MNNERRQPEPPASVPIVEMKGLALHFEEHSVLSEVNFRVERRERMVVLGQSGAGKSTILRLILGVLRPSAGEVFFNGKNLAEFSRYKLNAIRSRIGMVYQSSALISSLTVRDNLALPLEELTEKGSAEIEQIVHEKLALVGMEETGPLMPAELSGGMRKRVAIARALVMDPELLLFDEPTTGLDPVLAAVIDELIISLSTRAHATCIVVTHELDSAFRVATRMAMLYRGRIVEEDEPNRFRQSNNPVVEQFMESRVEGPIR